MRMNGFIKKTLVGIFLGGSALSLSGCAICSNCIDPCYPERYNYMARDTVNQTMYTQAANGHVLDQTVWNEYFETDPNGRPTDRLNATGMEHLTYLVRRRPNPDPKIYLQTSHDLVYKSTEDPEKFAIARAELDNRRLEAVQKYLAAMTSGRNLGYDFVIMVHDPAEVGLAATPIGGNIPPNPLIGSVQQLWFNFRGVLPGDAVGGGAGGMGSGFGGGQVGTPGTGAGQGRGGAGY
jgi:hypothetical protein